ncbi:uncharacterized protein [Gossypium hirsutum]|uniref:Uncharacterized protein n=1 Tax=Gossypium hirsutum TaxID=3635 RepID=A0A1U8JPW4_GOSHI|nr:uncharacterized protein LOC107908003 [Gossypium hirsutum]
MAPYEALYGRNCRTPSCWTELGERRVLGPELVFDTEDKVRLIQDQLKAASDRQKSYCRSDPTHVVSTVEIEVRPDLNFKEEPVQILDRNVKILRNKSITLVKVLWRNHSSEEAMWEPEEAMRQ